MRFLYRRVAIYLVLWYLFLMPTALLVTYVFADVSSKVGICLAILDTGLIALLSSFTMGDLVIGRFKRFFW